LDYHFNFSYIWRHFDRLWYGLILSLELALVSIVIGMVIGLALALVYTGGGRVRRTLVAAYVEFIRNVPLLLLVYLVFYGVPTIGGFSYGATTSFIITLAAYSGAYLVEVFRAGLDAVPRGLIDAGKAIGLTPWQRLVHIRLPTMFRIVLPSLSNTYI
jgi:polar amino acid transport system permease protein